MNMPLGKTHKREKLKSVRASRVSAEVTAAADFDIRGQKPVPLLKSMLPEPSVGLRDATAERCEKLIHVSERCRYSFTEKLDCDTLRGKFPEG